MRVLKYTLETTDRQSLSMPAGAKILTVQTQYEMCQLWALVDETENVREARHFVIVGMGNPFPDGIHFTFIGTYQLRSGGLVFHVFEVLK